MHAYSEADSLLNNFVEGAQELKTNTPQDPFTLDLQGTLTAYDRDHYLLYIPGDPVYTTTIRASIMNGQRMCTLKIGTVFSEIDPEITVTDEGSCLVSIFLGWCFFALCLVRNGIKGRGYFF